MNELIKNFDIEKVLSQLATWFQTQVLALDNLVQLVAIIVTGLIAYYLNKKICKKFLSDEDVFTAAKSKSKIRSVLTPVLRKLMFPLLWLTFLALAAGAFSLLQDSYPIIRTAIQLILAWAVIRLGSHFIDNPFYQQNNRY